MESWREENEQVCVHWQELEQKRTYGQFDGMSLQGRRIRGLNMLYDLQVLQLS